MSKSCLRPGISGSNPGSTPDIPVQVFRYLLGRVLGVSSHEMSSAFGSVPGFMTRLCLCNNLVIYPSSLPACSFSKRRYTMIIGFRRVSTRLPSQLKTAKSFIPASIQIRRSLLHQKSTMADFKVVFTKDAAARKSYIRPSSPIAFRKQVPTAQ